MALNAGKVVALKNLQQQTYELLVSRILGLERGYEPGSRLDIPALAAELGVSPTPIKESLRLLQAHGLIEMSPRRGTYVAALSREQFDDYIDVLRELEFAALRLAGASLPADGIEKLNRQVDIARAAIDAGREVEAYQANQAFHEVLVELSGNRELVNLYSSPRGYLLTVAYRSRDPELERQLLAQHVEIADALAGGRHDEARERIITHWEDCRVLGHAAIDEFERRTATG
jgi:GntR family transcriptional regulator, rspAB operon transcriptional repressor